MTYEKYKKYHKFSTPQCENPHPWGGYVNQIPTPCLTPPPLGLTLIGALMNQKNSTNQPVLTNFRWQHIQDFTLSLSNYYTCKTKLNILTQSHDSMPVPSTTSADVHETLGHYHYINKKHNVWLILKSTALFQLNGNTKSENLKHNAILQLYKPHNYEGQNLPEFAFLGLVQRLEVAELILEEF